jgi:threonine dehydrogenase-like Zn-dependent dehydrogenase
MLKEGLVDVSSLVTHTFPLEETEKGIRSIKDCIGDPIKVQIKVS